MLKILIAECEHIHNKVLFDCINDSLLQFKPYGKEGEPLPWSRKNRRLKPTDDFSVNEIFEIEDNRSIKKILSMVRVKKLKIYEIFSMYWNHKIGTIDLSNIV